MTANAEDAQTVQSKPETTSKGTESINEQEMDQFLAALASETVELMDEAVSTNDVNQNSETKEIAIGETISSDGAAEKAIVEVSEKIENDESSSSSSDSDSDVDTSSSEDEAVEHEDADEFEKDDDDDWIPRTRNEIIEEEAVGLPKDFEMKPDSVIEPAGKITSVSSSGVVVIKAATSGKYRILSEGVVFCLGNRVLLGALSETFGPIEQPFYVLRLKKEALEDLHLEAGLDVFYVVSTSEFVLTETFKSKGSDASNFNDEEVPLEEQEFSDDEEEVLSKQATKRRRKRKQQSNEKSGQGPTDGAEQVQKAAKISSGPQRRQYPSQYPGQQQPHGRNQYQVRPPQMPGHSQGFNQNLGPTYGGQNQFGMPPPAQGQAQQPNQQQQGFLAAWYSYAQRFFGQDNSAPPY